MPIQSSVSVRQKDIKSQCDKRRSERLFRRCDNPTLPVNDSLYAKAKRLEYDGDIAGALDLLLRAMQSGDRVDSCMKDIAGLLNMMGRTFEAVEFLKAHQDKVTNRVGYMNLLVRLENELERSDVSDLPRSLTVTVVDKSLGPVTMTLCDRMFPNPAKVRRILYTDEEGYIGAVHFASHSSARKALQVQKECPHQFTCTWSGIYTDARLRMLERVEKDSTLPYVVACLWEKMPSHLSNYTIPIYRESDPSLPVLSREEIEKLQNQSLERVESSVVSSPISSVGTPTGTSNSVTSTESVVMATVLANHQHMFGAIDVGGVSPFLTKIPSTHSGDLTSALVIPFPDTPECLNEQPNQVRSYAHTLSLMSSAMFTVAAVMESGNHGDPNTVFSTPIKPQRPPPVAPTDTTNIFNTPSPVIQRNIFT